MNIFLERCSFLQKIYKIRKSDGEDFRRLELNKKVLTSKKHTSLEIELIKHQFVTKYFYRKRKKQFVQINLGIQANLI